jgi:queuosine biosynthesis protein QueC
MKPAVVLLSGGLDSSTVLALARSERFECYALSFAYGQRHSRELESARRVAEALGVKEHLILSLDLHRIGGLPCPACYGSGGQRTGFGDRSQACEDCSCIIATFGGRRSTAPDRPRFASNAPLFSPSLRQPSVLP